MRHLQKRRSTAITAAMRKPKAVKRSDSLIGETTEREVAERETCRIEAGERSRGSERVSVRRSRVGRGGGREGSEARGGEGGAGQGTTLDKTQRVPQSKCVNEIDR